MTAWSRAAKKIRYQNRTQSVSAWAEEFGLEQGVLWQRLFKLNWPIDEALSTAKRRKGVPRKRRSSAALAPQPWTFDALLRRYRGPAILRAVKAGLAVADENLQERYLNC